MAAEARAARRFVMKASTKRMARGMFLEVRGMTKGMIGSVTANRGLRMRGRLDLFSGRMQRRVGRFQWACGF